MSEDEILKFVIGSILIMLFLSLAVIWFFNYTQKKIIQAKIEQHQMEIEFQEQLLHNTVKIKEKERTRIAKELHDDIASQLNIIHLNLHLLKKKISGNEEINKIVDHIESSLKSSAERTRNISHQLMPPTLSKFGIHHALKELVNDVNISEVFEFKLEKDYLIEIRDEYKIVNIYRIVQELLSNAIKYSKCKLASLSFEKDNDYLIMNYQDDGVGFNIEDKFEGLGIVNIRARLRLLGGTMTLKSAPNKGTKYRLKFPNYD